MRIWKMMQFRCSLLHLHVISDFLIHQWILSVCNVDFPLQIHPVHQRVAPLQHSWQHGSEHSFFKPGKPERLKPTAMETQMSHCESEKYPNNKALVLWRIWIRGNSLILSLAVLLAKFWRLVKGPERRLKPVTSCQTLPTKISYWTNSCNFGSGPGPLRLNKKNQRERTGKQLEIWI